MNIVKFPFKMTKELRLVIEKESEQLSSIEYCESLTPTQKIAFTRTNLTQHGLEHLLDQLPQDQGIEVSLDNISYTATFHVSQNVETTKHPIPTVVKPFNAPDYSSLFLKKKLVTQHVLHNINALFKPGTMTMILGPPGCGKSTLLNLIAAGTLVVEKNESLTGEIRYNNQLPDQLNLTDMATLVSQDDHHIPTLTVQETLRFAQQCQQGEDEFATMDVGALLSLLGLEECEDTQVGDDLKRGVSGGQKKRVTIGEMLCGILKQQVICMDEFSTGLDSSTTYEIAKVLHQFTHQLNKTTIVAMLQPPPEVYELFDNILVLDCGELVYNGSRTELPAYFESIGYRCPPRQDIADFIQEVTTPTGNKYRISPVSPSSIVQTPRQFAELFTQSCFYHHKPTRQVPIAQTKEKAPQNRFKVLLSRQIQQSARDVEFNRVRIGQATVMGLVIGSLFYNVAKEKVQTKMGLLFLSLLFQALTTFSAVDAVFKLRTVLYKQMDRGFFPVLTYTVVESLVEFIRCLPQAFLFCTPIYWLAGLSSSATAFVFFIVVVLFIGLVYMQLFKLAAAISSDVVLAKICCGGTVFLGLVFSGYMVPEANIPIGWIGLYWVNPFAWALKALALNEFKSSSYDDSAGRNLRIGDVYLKSFGLTTNISFMYAALLVLFAMYVCLLLFTFLAYAFIRYRRKKYYYIASSCYAEEESFLPQTTAKTTEFIPITLSFQQLSYGITVNKKDERLLLRNIHGYFLPGTLTALMGSTGAGKTTLLDVLSGRKVNSTSNQKEKIYINGRLLADPHEISHVMGYVEQNDIHVLSSTVGESLEFSAELRMCSKDLQQKEQIIQEMLSLLELEADVLVSNLSPGQTKRLTIGVELVSNPSVLFCDEPTSGLDARAAHRVVTCLERIARSGRTVICTIHQPSTSLFEMFDSLLLLQTGGEMVYFGPLGEQESSVLVDYFHKIYEKHDLQNRQIPLNKNPASYMLECLNDSGGLNFPQEYFESREYQETQEKIQQLHNEYSRGDAKVFNKKYQHGFPQQFRLLFRRCATQYWRSPSFNCSRLFLGVFFACVYGTVYSGHGELSTTLDLFSRMILLFIGPLFMGICCMMMMLPVVSADRAVFYRERASRMYSVAAYTLSLGIVEAIYSFIIGSVFVNIFYWYVGLEQVTDSWLWFWMVNVLGMLTWVYIGHFLVFTLNDLQSAVVIAGAFSALMIIFSGFMINEAKMLDFWTLIYWISPMHYQLEALIVTQFSQNHNLIQVVETPGLTVSVAQATASYFSGSFQYSHRWADLCALVFIIAIFQLGSYLSLKFINHLER